MEIRIDGNRSTDESWTAAYSTPPEALPELTPDEQAVARQMRLAPEQYKRTKLAAELATPELAGKATRVAGLVHEWLRAQGREGTVSKVVFNTLLGRFRLEIELPEGSQIVQVKEALMDNLLELGSATAEQDLDRLLAANLGRRSVARAS